MTPITPLLDFPALSEISIREDIPQDTVTQALSTPPFIPIALALNFRTITSPTLAPNIVYRSGVLSHLPATSLSMFKSRLGIATIFDLRSRSEREKSPSPEIEGIETVWVPSTIDTEPSVVVLDAAATKPETGKDRLEVQSNESYDFATNDGETGYISMYSDILRTHKEPYKAVFQKLRDSDGAILFHCTAGKDRTGVLAALMHALLDSPEDIIALDYGLTRVGIEPFKERLLRALLERMGKADGTTLLDLFAEDPSFEAIASVRKHNILAFLLWLNEKYGSAGHPLAEGSKLYSGAKGYLVQELGFSVEDLIKMKQRLAVQE